jgi:lipid-binding SYLF domain-containing protein
MHSSKISRFAAGIPTGGPIKGSDRNRTMTRIMKIVIAAVVVGTFSASPAAMAASAAEIDVRVKETIEVFKKDVNGADVFLQQSAGYLVFPKVYKVGVGVGGETGEGALLIGNEVVDYYRTSSGSVGFQLGAQARSIVIVFMTKESLDQFRNSEGWKVGIDGSVALIDLGAGKTIDSKNIKDPVVGFIFGSKGLMYNLTLEGTKIHKLDKS